MPHIRVTLEFIPVEERLPKLPAVRPIMTRVLMLTNHGFIESGIFSHTREFQDWRGVILDFNITHWAEISEIAKEGE